MARRKKVQKDKQRSTKHTYKTKDGVTQTQLKTGLMLTSVCMNMDYEQVKIKKRVK
jgi:hypothetical protein